MVVMDGDDDTLTESCEGATGFMVDGVSGGSLRELPEMVVEGLKLVKTEESAPQIANFFFRVA
jgi:hypothetical protein